MIMKESMVALKQWNEWAKSYSMLPYLCKYPLETDRPLSWEKAWEQSSDYAFVLESGKVGRYSYLGLSPAAVLRGKGLSGVMEDFHLHRKEELVGPPLQLVKQWLAQYRTPQVAKAPKFTGGIVGYWGYDVVRTIEELPSQAADDLSFPDYYFMRIQQLWIIDHEEKALYCALHVPLDNIEEGKGSRQSNRRSLEDRYKAAAMEADRMHAFWREIVDTAAREDSLVGNRIRHCTKIGEQERLQLNPSQLSEMSTPFRKEKFIQAVQGIQQYICAGDCFQVNLSVRQTRKLRTTAEDIYEWLRLLNPSPYMSFLHFPELKIVSVSPELLVKLENGIVSTRPIAGTRPRGMNEKEDRRLAGELIANEKERAEHIMLVDLERNDLGRISRYGTVQVSELMVTEYYSHVMHIVSEVRGELAPGKDAFDVIAATFPGGTITGAPKIRTMEIIEELEPVRRGIYTGSIGWIDYHGNMEFNIVIRTLIASEGLGHVQAGAGIVTDSIPEKEYEESLNKAKALWKAMEYSEQFSGQYMRTV